MNGFKRNVPNGNLTCLHSRYLLSPMVIEMFFKSKKLPPIPRIL